MIRSLFAALLITFALAGGAAAQTCSVPNTLTNGTNADATQVMANFNALLSCVNSAPTPTVSTPGGFLNKFRNPGMDVAQRGMSGALSSTNNYYIDGWIIYFSGCSSIAVTQVNLAGTQNGAVNALRVTAPAGGCTDIKIAQRIESTIAAPLSFQTATWQVQFLQNTGSPMTPTGTGCYAGATGTDNWNKTSGSYCGNNNTYSTTDSNLSAAGMTALACASGSWCTAAYTWNVNANAYKGYELDLDCGAVAASTYCEVTAADVRPTPGVTTGVNSNPPPPELRPISIELAFNQRYFWRTPSAFWLPGWFAASNGFNGHLQFPMPMRANPTGMQYGTTTNALVQGAAGSQNSGSNAISIVSNMDANISLAGGGVSQTIGQGGDGILGFNGPQGFDLNAEL